MKPYCRSCRVSAVCLSRGADNWAYHYRYAALSLIVYDALLKTAPETFRQVAQDRMSCGQYEYDPMRGYKEG